MYVASYYTVGGYAQDVGYFENSGVTSGPLYALSAGRCRQPVANSRGRRQRCVSQGTGGGFPTNSYAGTNYWVDVAFNVGKRRRTAAGRDRADTRLGHNRASPPRSSSISATFNEPVIPASRRRLGEGRLGQ